MVRHEITTAVQHSQELLMDKLEKTARPVRQIDQILGCIISNLNTAGRLLQ